jgi:4'-phosphopantetheinyl transferase
MPACLHSSQVHVWYYAWEGSLDPAWLAELYPALSSQEREQHRRFHFDRDRDIYLLAHILLRRVLSRYCDIQENAWEFVSGSHGKPFIATPHCEHLHFSLTHTAGLVACAVRAHAEVGVDAESIDRECDFIGIARSTFAAVEVRELEKSPPAVQRELFFRYWTLKEAYVKALGLGLSASLTDFSIDAGMKPDATTAKVRFSREEQGKESDWRLRLHYPTPRHVLASAFHMPESPELSVYDAAALLQNPL